MGTNFYARRIPTQEEIAALHKRVDEVAAGICSVADITDVIESSNDIHLGKRSAGWQFIWEYHPECYSDNLESIKKFLSRDDIMIIDEYGTKFSLDEFLNEEIGYCLYNDPEKYINGRQYDKKQYGGGYVVSDGEWTSEDGLRFGRGEFC